MLLNLRRLPVLGLLIGGVFITGCHSMVTTKMFDEGMVASYQKESDGIEYFLPKKLLRVTVNRKIVPSDIVKKTAKAAEDAKAKAEEAEKAWKVAKETAEMATKVAGKVDTDGVEKAKRLAAIRKAEADVLEEKAKTAKTAAENALKAAEAASADNQAVEIAVDARTVADLAMKKAEIAKSKYEEEEKAVLEKGVDKGKLDAAIDSLRALQIAELKLKESKGKLGEAEAAAKKDPTDMGAQENLKDAKSKYKAAEEKVGITQGLLDKRVKESEVAREFISRIEKLETEKTKLEAKKKEASDQAEQALKAAGLAMVVIDEKKYEDEISIEELPLIADTSQRFVADLNHRIWREDTLKLTTTPNGLLQTTEGESSDKSGEIIKTLAQTAKEVFKAMAGLPSGATPLTAEEEKVPEKKLCPEYPGTEVLRGIQKKPFSAQYTFDPTNPEKVDEVNKEFCKLGTKFIILVTAVDGQSDQTSTPASVKLRKMQDKSVQCKEKTPLEINGLVYRRATPYTIEVRELRV